MSARSKTRLRNGTHALHCSFRRTYPLGQRRERLAGSSFVGDIRGRGLVRAFALLALAIAQAATPPASAAAAAEKVSGPSPDEVVGLWKAQKRFGSDARMPLIINRDGDSWSADILGQILPLRVNGRELAFTHPDGAFTGELTERQIMRGHWLQGKSPVHYRYGYATPVVLTADVGGHWRGQVRPADNALTFFLKVDKRQNGTLGAFLRNPERNLGKQYDVDQLLLEGETVQLMGKLEGKGDRQLLISGRYDAKEHAILLDIPETGDDRFVFTRDDDHSLFYPRGRDPGRYVYRPPVPGEDGWPIATLEEVNIDRPAVERFIQMLTDMPIESVGTPQVEAILVARHGKLIVEEYFHGEHRDKVHDTRSAGKSVVATLVGAVMQAGAPLTLSSPVYKVMNGGNFPSDLEPRKRAMKLEDLLMMRSGYFCDDSRPEAPGNENVMWERSNDGSAPSTYQYTLGVPMAHDPGTVSIYCSSNPNLALGVVGRATGEPQLRTFDRLVAEPMQIKHYAWNMDTAGDPYGGGGSRFLPRDFLKFGQLMLNGGTWNGRRILSADFVQRASAPLHDLKRIQYGYLWWSIEVPYKNRTTRGFLAGGNGGQGVLVFPELDLVVGTFAGNYGDSVGLHIQQDFPVNYILPATREPGDDPKTPVVPGNFSTPYGLPGVPNPK